MHSRRLLLAAILGVLAASPARAQEAHHHAHGSPEKLGHVHFPVSCTPAAQEHFTRGVALLHSFWYGEAEQAFNAAGQADPACAMAHWGIAMSLYHPIWAPPSSEALQKGQQAVSRATSARTERERDYIAAISVFYQDADKLDHRARALAYEKAMEAVHQRHPEDDEAAIFYALALLGTAPPTDKTYANQKKAGALLEKILPRQPEHPGVAHYLIHSYDYPSLAPLGLNAARSYAHIAESSPHALHMPSHIFTRLGMWPESIQSNRASAQAAREWVARAHPGKSSFDQLHAMDYLTYAYLQGAQDQQARALFEDLKTIAQVDVPNFAAAYAFAAIPGRYALERGRYAEAAAIQVHPATFPWDKFPYAESMFYFARALGAARTGQPQAARPDVDRLATLHQNMVQAGNAYWAGQVEIQHRAAAAWLALAEGENEQALALMHQAADLEDATDKHPVTPAPIAPARELLAEMLLELDRPAEALAAFEAGHRTEPNRFRGLLGAARAARQAGDTGRAATYYTQLIALCARAEGERPEYTEAENYLAGK